MVCHERNNLHESGDYSYEIHIIESELIKKANLKKAPQSHKVRTEELIRICMVEQIGKVTFDYRSIIR